MCSVETCTSQNKRVSSCLFIPLGNTVKHIIKKMNEYNSSEEPISKEQAVEETAENNVDILLEIFSKHGIKDDDMLVQELKEWKDNL